jgi:signal transduction histidine kinase
MDAVQRQCSQLVHTLKGVAWAEPDELPEQLAAARRLIAHVESPHGLDGAISDTLMALERLRELFVMMRGLVGRSHGVRREPVDLWALIPEVRKMLVDDLAGIEVEVIGEPLCVLADKTLLGQLVLNLTSNAAQAAKLLSAPRVRLHVYRRDTGAVISVRDNGPGIAADLLERIFEPFFTTRRGNGGIGLGLALCREYALQMSAELSVWSLPGRGACFRVYLPELLPD